MPPASSTPEEADILCATILTAHPDTRPLGACRRNIRALQLHHLRQAQLSILGMAEKRRPDVMYPNLLTEESASSIPSKHVSSASSPATSVSASLSSLAAAPAEATEEECILAELGNYIPLGCLLTTLPSGNLESPGGWTELDTSKLATLTLEPRMKELITRLLEAKWIRVQCAESILRLYILPHDVARRFIDRSIKKDRQALEHVLRFVSVSADLWNGKLGNERQKKSDKFDPWATAENSSLFYLFNTLPSPSPDIESVRDPYARSAMQDILDINLPGLNAKLYPFQARSAALMLQREASQELFLDPRLETRRTPDGQEYYFNPRDTEFYRNPRWFESNRSGILAEGMGSGKTIIAISLILATKHHLPKIPPGCQTGPATRPRVGSLFQMAAAATGRHSVPWKAAVARHEDETGEELTECIKELKYHSPCYEIPAESMRSNRQTTLPHPKKMTMCSGTIVVVPRNLLHQWQSELGKHIEEGRLKVLVMDNPQMAIPPLPELVTYDIVLFSRPRFELEIRDGSDEHGRRPTYTSPPACRCSYIGASRTPDCTCLTNDDLYISPLKQLHWLRIMIDEGHNFSSQNSNAVLVAKKLVKAERRWVISGTPAKDDLLGVEVDLASNEHESSSLNQQLVRDKVLEQRKSFGGEDASGAGAGKSLGQLFTHFLQVRPWASEANYEDQADWLDHVYRHHDYKRRTFNAFSQCMRKALQQLIVKTQPYDVEKDLILPPLSHRVVRLEPSFYDKISANLFVLVLTGNAVTSERTDIDYLFHARSQQARNQLITNLRQSNFFWTGFSKADIGNAVENGRKYLIRNKNSVQCSDNDRQLLMECIHFAETYVLASENWKAMSATHEIGLFVESWPESSSHAWALGKEHPELYGIAQLLQAQAYVNQRLATDPMEGFEAAGKGSINESYSAHSDTAKQQDMKMGLPSSSVKAEVTVSKLHVQPKNSDPTPKKGTKQAPAKASRSSTKNSKKAKAETAVSTPTETPRKRPRDNDIELSRDSPLGNTQIVGTVSAKLSYLLGQVMTYYRDEKILIFYDGDNAAYYIAQCLDLLGVPHEIYSKGISNELRSRYIVNFDQDPTLRVLLMDVRLGALGLNVNQASRVYFINPVCRPSIEAQAVKRAHRIGQTKPVYVETLILSGTIEEAMFERSKAMTRNEHMEAKTLEDDQKITDIIKSARMLPVTAEEAVGERQMTPLKKPEQLFGRPGRGALCRTTSPKRQKKVPSKPEASREEMRPTAVANMTMATPAHIGRRRARRQAAQRNAEARAANPPTTIFGEPN